MIKKQIIHLVFCLLIFSCGSGTFEDDPESWNKVFGEDTPNEIEITNSRFWKSAHWTYEFEYYCKFKSNDLEFLNEYFIKHYKMAKQNEKMSFHSDNKPKWFIQNQDGFDVWEKGFSMALYYNEESKVGYLYCIQL